LPEKYQEEEPVTIQTERLAAELFQEHLTACLGDAGCNAKVASFSTTDRLHVVTYAPGQPLTIRQAEIAARVLGELGVEYTDHGPHGITFGPPPTMPNPWDMTPEPACIHGWVRDTCPNPRCPAEGRGF
jgi:hypothetical protein